MFTTVNIMLNRELSPSKAPLNLEPLTQALKTPERLWMAVLLINQYTENPTIREFSKISDLSIGFISKFANILRDSGFLAPGQRLNLLEPGALLNLIRDLYFFEANRIIPYYTEDTPEQVLEKISKSKQPYALTRMCGSALVAPYVRYQLVDFYIPDEGSLAYWKKTLGLVDVEVTGNINLVLPQNPRILNQLQTVKGYKVVNNIQLYLDLYKYPSRGREQAEHLREKVLKI